MDNFLLLPKVIIFFQIVFIDVIMAADNAIVIGLIASSFPKADRQRIIMLGIFAAFIFRVIFALITVQLLQFPLLKIIGGFLLLWITIKLIKDLDLFGVFRTLETKNKIKKQPSFAAAVYSVIIADVTLSFDNVLGVAAAARDEWVLLVFGLLLSVLLIGTTATYFANLLKKKAWIGIVASVVIIIVALQLIYQGFMELPKGII